VGEKNILLVKVLVVENQGPREVVVNLGNHDLGKEI
jgi:hypothetical protein